MDPTLAAAMRSWAFEPRVTLPLVLAAAIYVRGWLLLHRRDYRRWSRSKLAAFLGGLSAIFLALASPIEPFSALLLQVHMVQHLLLMMVAPPLIWLGAPFFPLMRGLPREIRTHWIAPLVRWTWLRYAFRVLTNPPVAWLLFTAVTWLWHAPVMYALAMRSDGWHYVQHACFLGTAFLFWYPVVRPYPSRPSWSPWLLVPYLLLADLQNTLLAALLTFSDQPLYSYYAQRPHLGNLPPLEDQAAAGVIMWVPGSLAYLVPLFWIGVHLLFADTDSRRKVYGGRISQDRFAARRTQPRRSPSPRPVGSSTSGRLALPVLTEPRRVASPEAFDVLAVPLLGRLLRWRHARLSLQLPLLALAGIVVYDGLRGPPVGAMNLAGVLPWIHWRGLVVLGLLAVGNFFCMACPFLVPRTLARWWRPASRPWPSWLRNKWPAIVLLVVFLWAYEALALWDSPWWTAWIILAYFGAAFLVDGIFRGASFCKYVCPVGQFNFVQSLISPLEIKVRDRAVCGSCRTKDCIRGRDGIPGCELHLYQPRKSSNMDCTFCLDCIHACPHDNIGILATSPGVELRRDSERAGIGRFGRRWDVAVLTALLVFAAFANAAGMTAPVLAWLRAFTSVLGLSAAAATGVFYFVALLLLPLLMIGGSALLSRWWGQVPLNVLQIAKRYTYALVPLGFSMWLAHYGYHFFTSYASVLPTTQRFLGDLGCAVLGAPQWNYDCCAPVAGWLLRAEIVSLEFGLLLSLYTGYRIAWSQAGRLPQAFRMFAPWGLLIALLFAAGIWIIFQPMQMRGTMLMTG
jgi:cytochrome c oxidase assembly factor CtaG/ferredoxin